MAVWPLFQYAASVYWETNPWKFFGWAMYTVPPPQVQMGMGEIHGGQIDWDRRREVPRPLLEEGFRFLDRRTAYGRLHAPDELAGMALAAFPETEGVAIRVRSLVLNRESARLVPRDQVYVYPR
jgi:hypothetical protein